MQHQQAVISWRDGSVPVAERFDDPYYSLENGLAETEHVFLAANGLPERFRDGFHIAELGFGTGLNALVAAKAWKECGAHGQLQLHSFEAYPMAKDDIARALAPFDSLDAAPLLDVWPAADIALDAAIRLHVVFGDARETLPAWTGRADAWFLDGFAPAKNPELWEAGLMRAVFEKTALGGTFATYTAAGDVRRALGAAGFAVERVAGYGRKRHMTRGARP